MIEKSLNLSILCLVEQDMPAVTYPKYADLKS